MLPVLIAVKRPSENVAVGYSDGGAPISQPQHTASPASVRAHIRVSLVLAAA